MSDNIVKHGQLQEVTVDLWKKAKKRDITALTYEANTKTIKGTNDSDQNFSVSAVLSNLASVDERTKFKKDVSVDDAGAATNINIGTVDNNQSKDRIVGYRGLTSKKFVDNYVEKLVVHTKSDLDDGINTTWKVWAVKKGTNRDGDRILKAYHNNGTISAQSKTLSVNGVPRKCIEIPIRQEFDSETYFLVKCTSHLMQVLVDIKQDFRADVINMSVEPSGRLDSIIDWSTNEPNNTAIIHLVGRESISSLAEKIRNTQADSSKYVLQTETTTVGGNAGANKVARLDDNGKLHTDMMPSIAINEYIEVSAFNHTILQGTRYENGDVIVVTSNGRVTKRYLCIKKNNNPADLTEDFVELNSKDGIITSVNTQRPGADGNVTINAEHIKYINGQTTTVKEELDKKISNIALHNTNKKKLNITKANGTTTELDLTDAFKSENISYSGTIGGATKSDVKAAIDALNEEAKKGVKKINNGTPDDQGNIAVAVSQTGDAITMTFGAAGGTPVTVATYMTNREVEDIKALFT